MSQPVIETKKLEIIELTYPLCKWCWGSEPVLRTLETRFGSQLKLSYVMGGLVKDITTFYDSYNNMVGMVHSKLKKTIQVYLIEKYSDNLSPTPLNF